MVKQDNIQHLSPRDHVRLRPGMYISNITNPNHLMIETFANALDMHNAGYGNNIIVTIDKNNVCTCEDQGTGFQINKIDKENNETILQMAFDLINSSGKYSKDGFYNGSSLGSNGVGIKAVNFLSEWLEVKSWNNGRYEKLRFERGILKDRELGKCSEGSGTIVSYLPDKEIFDTIKTDEKYFQKFFNDISFLCNKLTIIFNGKEIHHDSIESAIDDKIKDVELFSNRLVINKEKLNLVMTYSAAASSLISCYVNYGYTDAGPHITMIKSIITRTLNKFAKENNLLKKGDKNLEGSALQEGLVLICNIVGTDIVYDSQSKQRVTKMDTSILSTLGEELEAWIDNNPDDGRIIIEKALVARKAAEAAKKARERVRNNATKQTKKKKFIDMPTTLIDANGKDRSKCELIIVEGLSPASSLVAERDALVSAIYSVRGMMLNCRKTTEEKIMQNKEINNLVSALGLDFNPKNGKMKYDKNKLRYGKIIAASDADAPGAAIENLLFNILWYLCPELILNGHVYSAEPPLFKITTKKNKYIFLADQQALNNYMKEHSSEVATVHRAKGLAEMHPQELAAFILDPDTRQIKQLVVNDFEETEQLFEDLYGKNVPPRVDYINNNIWGVEVDYE